MWLGVGRTVPLLPRVADGEGLLDAVPVGTGAVDAAAADGLLTPLVFVGEAVRDVARPVAAAVGVARPPVVAAGFAWCGAAGSGRYGAFTLGPPSAVLSSRTT